MQSDTVQLLTAELPYDDEEQDEPLAAQEHGLTIDNLHYPLYSRLCGPSCSVAEEIRVYRDAEGVRRQDYYAPDVLVALGVPDRVRPRYVIAEEGKAPDLVIEVLSESSLDNGDLERKRDWYRREGVREYVVVDPLGKFAPEPRLQTWRFRDASGRALFEPIHIIAEPDAVLHSEVAPFGWAVRDGWVRLVDLSTGEVLPALWEVDMRLRIERLERLALQQQMQAALDRAQAAEERAQVAQDQAQVAQEQARREAEARETLEREIERLRRELDATGESHRPEA